MSETTPTADEAVNSEQREYWTREGDHWVREADRFDAMNGPFGEAMLDAAGLESGDRVLDVGCGNGATAIEAARRVGPRGRVVAVDLSAAMLALARHRAEEAGIDNVELVLGDAQVHPFERGGFDAVISRFGTMFFEDPEAAFANLYGALRPGGRLAIVCWQDVFHSEWIIVPGGAAAEHVGLPDFGPPGAPGPFALADEQRLRAILDAAGFGEPTLDAITRPMRVGDDVDDALSFITSLPLVRDDLFAGKPPEKVTAAVDAARAALTPYAGPEGLVMNAGAWLVSAARG